MVGGFGGCIVAPGKGTVGWPQETTERDRARIFENRVRGFIEDVWNDVNEGKFDDYISDDHDYRLTDNWTRPPVDPAPSMLLSSGKDLRQFIRECREACPTLHIDVRYLMTIPGDTVLAWLAVTGEDAGSGILGAPTGKPFAIEATSVFQLRPDGDKSAKIIAGRHIMDFPRLYEQLGVQRPMTAQGGAGSSP